MKKLLLSLVISGISFCSYGQTFGGGSGTKEDPYKISTPEHIKELAECVNSKVFKHDLTLLYISDTNFTTYGQYFVLTQDIDMNGVTDFTPIGYIDTAGQRRFAGHFDGKGHIIRNLTYQGSIGTVGLFGAIIGATIEHVTLLDYRYTLTYLNKEMYFSKMTFYGGIVGDAKYTEAITYEQYQHCQSKLSHCEASGIMMLKKLSDYSGYISVCAGGIVGQGTCSIYDCKSFLSIKDSTGVATVCGIGTTLHQRNQMENCVAYTQGFSIIRPKTQSNFYGVGRVIGGTMRNCFASGSFTGQFLYGIGTADTMLYCGSNTALHGEWMIGAGSGNQLMSNCYFTGSLTLPTGQTLSTLSAPLCLGSRFVENCYVAPSKYPAELKTSFISQIAPTDAFPVRHCFVSSNVTISDSVSDFHSNLLGQDYAHFEITKLNDDEMKLPSFAAILNQYNGSSEWQQDIYPYRNNGYPLLRNHFAAATVTTLAADSVTDHSARLHASFYFGDESGNLEEYGIQWKKQSDSTWNSDTTLLDGSTLSLDNLAEQTTYMFRGYITRSIGEMYGETMLFTTNKTIAVRESRQELQFSVSPVPASNILTVTGAAGAEACLYTTLGQKVLQIRLESESSSIDVSGLASGSYLLQIRKDGKHGVCKVQIQR